MPIWGRGEGLLEAKNISAYYGQVKAIENVSISVRPGEIVAMIGPNGAGKSTALKAIFGMVDIKSGDIRFNGESIKDLRPDEHVSRAYPFTRRQEIIPSMTVIENLEMGAFLREGDNGKADIENILELLPALKDKKTKAGVLSTGEQQMLAMGRALMQKPKLLLADEPSLGLSPTYVDTIFEKLVEINKSGTIYCWSNKTHEWPLRLLTGYVFKIGSIFMEDTGENLLKSDEVKKAF